MDDFHNDRAFCTGGKKKNNYKALLFTSKDFIELITIQTKQVALLSIRKLAQMKLKEDKSGQNNQGKICKSIFREIPSCSHLEHVLAWLRKNESSKLKGKQEEGTAFFWVAEVSKVVIISYS